jgi:hypothetical protein
LDTIKLFVKSILVNGQCILESIQQVQQQVNLAVGNNFCKDYQATLPIAKVTYLKYCSLEILYSPILRSFQNNWIVSFCTSLLGFVNIFSRNL